MSYNGSGTFSINTAGQPVITGTVISSTAFNALTADLGTGLSTAITKDGQTTTTSRILFAQGISSTLVTDATSTTTGSIITAGGISTQKALFVGTTSNFAGTITGAAANFTSIGATTPGTGAFTTVTTTGNVTTTQNTSGTAAHMIDNTNTSGFSLYQAKNDTNTWAFGTGGTASAAFANAFQNTLVFYKSGISALSQGAMILSTTGLRVYPTTASTTTATGCLVLDGGLGVAGAIYAGSIQNTPIGATTPSTGAFTTLTTSGAATFAGITKVTFADAAVQFGVAGTTKGVRFYNNATGAVIEGVDSTLVASFQPLYIGGSAVNFTVSGSFVGGLTSTGINSTAIGAGTASTGRFTTVATTGAVGIGMTAVNILDITQSTASGATVKILNSNAGAGAYGSFDVSNGTSLGQILQYGASYTTSGIYRQNGTLVYGNGAGGLTLATGAAQPIYFGINGTEAARFDTSGILGIGITPSAWNTFNAAQVGLLSIASYTNGDTDISSNLYYNSGWKYIGTGRSVQIKLDSSTGGGDIKFLVDATGGTAAGATAGTEAARISSSGYLGIGTSSPTFSLHLSGSSASYAALASAASGSPVGFSYTSCQYNLINNAATGDIFRFLKSDGTVIGTNGIAGHLYFYIADSATGGNASTYIYTIFSEGNGTSNYAFTNVSSNVRGTDPVSSFTVVADGGNGAIKVRMTAATAGISNARVTASFFGVVTT